MSDLKNILQEEYRKKKRLISPQSLMLMIEGLMDNIGETLQEKSDAPPGKARRERSLRLPMQFPTEISVGQTPSSEDRDIFHTWMSKIAPEGDLGTKVKAIESFINNPPSLPVADTLSYLMFLNTFAFILQEFNASVAGFLWEPFLAALFGDESVQVPTSEGDIADVRRV